MGQHDLVGTWVGLRRKKREKPPLRFKIIGSLGKKRNLEFRRSLARLAHKYGLVVTPPIPPLDPKAKPPIMAMKKPKKRPRKK